MQFKIEKKLKSLLFEIADLFSINESNPGVFLQIISAILNLKYDL